jgi:multiple sugar transport system substrate-binding protein
MLARAAAAPLAAGSGSVRAQEPPPGIRVQVPDIALAQTVQSVISRFTEETGFQVHIRLVAAESALFTLREDARTGNDDIDSAIVPMWHIGDLLNDELIQPLGPLGDVASGPPIDFDAELPAVRVLRRFGGDPVATPLDADCQLLYFRRDLIEDAAHSRDYHVLTGATLRVPETWEELEVMAAYFATAGVDGIALHLSQPGLGFWQYLAAATSITDASSPRFWFDLESFAPAIASAPHVEALALFGRLFATGSPEQLAWSLPEAWNRFVTGQAVFTIAGPDLLTSAIQLERLDREAIGIAPLTGISRAGDGTPSPTADSLRTGNALGACWGGVIRNTSRFPQAAWHFLSLLAEATFQKPMGWQPADGVDPGRQAQFPAEMVPDGQVSVKAYVAAGFTLDQASEFATSIAATLGNPRQLPYLRIPSAWDYLTALDRRIGEYLTGEQPDPGAALALAAEDFTAITSLHGADRQRERYLRSLE